MVDEITEPMFMGTRAECWTNDQKKTFWGQAEIMFGMPHAIVTNEDLLEVLTQMPFVGPLSVSTFSRMVKDRYGVTIMEYRKRHQGTLKARIMRKQIEKALKGDSPMLKWLGQNLLGQSDRIKNETTQSGKLVINIGEIKNDPLVTSSFHRREGNPTDASDESGDAERTP